MPLVSLQELSESKVDVLVIGGGTSGLVTAVRLAQTTDLTVGVLEAGEYHENDEEVNVPGMMARGIHNPKYDWMYYTVPQQHVNGRSVLQSHGKGLGGSSMLNLLAFVRPAKEEIDAFEKLGNPGWNWKSILEYMKKSERLQIPSLSEETKRLFAVSPQKEFHGFDGPIAKSFPPHVTPLHGMLLNSFEALGVPRNLDNSTGRPVGAFLVPTSVDSETATRSYSANEYYAPNAELPNLLVALNASARKINFVKEGSGLERAVSVEIFCDGITATVAARKEIILSAGTFHTPQILELSGVGNSQRLGPLGIETVIDLPAVGENLQDHALVPTISEVDGTTESLEILHDPQMLSEHQQLYRDRKGILAGIPSSCFAFIPAQSLGSDGDLQRWEALSIPSGLTDQTPPEVRRGMEKQFDILQRWVKDPVHPFGQILNLNGHFPVPGLIPDPDKRYMTLLCAYTHPFSRGSVHVSSNDPIIPPAIDQNYLANGTDAEILSRLLAFIDSLKKTSPLSESIVSTSVPSFDKDAHQEEVDEYVRKSLMTVHHPVGTASMLPREDGGVVDPKLKVYGTSNLRVVDCSIIPLLVSSNIQSLAYAIGEKAADIIKEELDRGRT